MHIIQILVLDKIGPNIKYQKDYVDPIDLCSNFWEEKMFIGRSRSSDLVKENIIYYRMYQFDLIKIILSKFYLVGYKKIMIKSSLKK